MANSFAAAAVVAAIADVTSENTNLICDNKCQVNTEYVCSCCHQATDIVTHA